MTEKKNIVTSMKVDEETWKETKIAAIKEGKTLTEVLNEALETWLREQEEIKKRK